MTRGHSALLALLLWPATSLAQGQAGTQASAQAGTQPSTQAGTASPAMPARPDGERATMKFEWIREAPETGCGTRCRAWVAASGRISETTATDFEAFAKGLDLRGATVVLHSGGGMVDAGLALGRAFRRLGMVTTVGRIVPASEPGRGVLTARGTCASMCAFALLGGVRRSVPDEARVLVHQIWPSKLRDDALAASYTAGNMVRIQRELGQMARYTAEMGADMDFFEIAMRIPPWESLRPLTRDELRRMRVHNAEDAAGTTARANSEPAPVRVAHAAIPAVPTDMARGWTVARQGSRAVLTRQHPLTVEGQAIGTFEVAFGCSETPGSYQMTYREKRFAEAGAADRLTGVRMMVERNTLPLRIDSSSPSSGELLSVARGLVPSQVTGALAGPEARSLLVETLTAGKQRTAIRIGPAGFAEGLREIAAACPK
jgi:hypothetical protein